MTEQEKALLQSAITWLVHFVVTCWVARKRLLSLPYYLCALFPPLGIILVVTASSRCPRCRDPISRLEYVKETCPRCGPTGGGDPPGGVSGRPGEV